MMLIWIVWQNENVIGKSVFELLYNDVAVQYVSLYAIGTRPIH